MKDMNERFAAGGYIDGPTLTGSGEYPGRINPEVVMPLNRLKNLMPNAPLSLENIHQMFVAGQQVREMFKRAIIELPPAQVLPDPHDL